MTAVASPLETWGRGHHPGQWKALLAPMLESVASAEGIVGYVVITQGLDGIVEIHSNAEDSASLCSILLEAMPDA